MGGAQRGRPAQCTHVQPAQGQSTALHARQLAKGGPHLNMAAVSASQLGPQSTPERRLEA